MKSVTEFPVFKLNLGLKAKGDLTAAGKTPEEAATALGEQFKMEGDKLKHFNNACDVAGQNPEKLSRVLVVALAEGETVPAKAVKVEEHYYVPEFTKDIKPVMSKADIKTARDAKGKGGNKPKSSPWGISPEEKEAKKKASAAKASAT